MSIDYSHADNLHSLSGPRFALEHLFADEMPKSLLDVGCGIGTWIKAASDRGVNDFLGIDGVDIPAAELMIPREKFCRIDLTNEWSLGRRFDVALCLEVAEHLGAESSEVLIEMLAKHSDTIVFSAACPGQGGQGHVNCQWPVYWQARFNQFGYACSDKMRWALWNIDEIEPWYRQNLFVAKYLPDIAGDEPRIAGAIHPELFDWIAQGYRLQATDRVTEGHMPTTWYGKTLVTAVISKLRRKLTT